MRGAHLIEKELTKSVIGAFFEVYNELGFGFLEHNYVLALEIELLTRGHDIAREVNVPVFYKGARLSGQRIDLIVDNRVVVETKSSYNLPPTAIRQLCNYLRATELEVGLVLHFGPEPKFYRQMVTNDQKTLDKNLTDGNGSETKTN